MLIELGYNVQNSQLENYQNQNLACKKFFKIDILSQNCRFDLGTLYIFCTLVCKMVSAPKLLSITVISSLRRNEPPSLPPSCDRLITALMTFNESEVFTKSKVRTQEKRENWMVSNFRPLKTCLSQTIDLVFSRVIDSTICFSQI